jgi:glycosyltransferase involved in cell wall biosynthesis
MVQTPEIKNISLIPVVSIITVVLNGEKQLEETLQSVFTQDFKNYELIVIDGMSTDGTHAIIEKHRSKINRYLSEKDKGIYDAMNKGISMAKGEWLYFLNVGDTLKTPEVLSEIFSKPIQDADLIYGMVQTKNDPSGVDRLVGAPLKINDFYFSIPICHQAAFIRKELFGKLGEYDTDYRILADQEWFIRFFKNPEHRAAYVPIVIANYEIVGYSYLNRIRSLKEALRNSSKSFPPHIALTNYLLFPVKYVKVKLLKVFKNTSIYRKYREMRFGKKGN